ncbi:MAG TPA: TetR-like C-terminal domain-containing protein, partial [Polyangiaceae bacterium]|nr:TetR-like C-terminal domain-containing protein [Polyangiaceae bacterium]
SVGAKLDEKARSETGASFRLLIDRVAECQRAGYLAEGNSEQIALSIWSSMHGIVSLALSGHLGIEPAQATPLFDYHQAAILRAFEA